MTICRNFIVYSNYSNLPYFNYPKHAHNVLIHQNNIKLADFGLSKKISEASNYSRDVFGILPYIDPKCLSNPCDIKDENQLYVINPKSDVYSIGVLLWQLSSGRRPFYAENGQYYDASLAMEIKNGKREVIIEDTPVKYSNLYEGNLCLNFFKLMIN